MTDIQLIRAIAALVRSDKDCCTILDEISDLITKWSAT